MLKNIIETKALFEIIKNEKNEYPDKQGYTPLILLAKKISTLDNLSPEKHNIEEATANIIDFFTKFDETDFSNLEIFIKTANFSKNIIRDVFLKFLAKNNITIDVVLKANIIRFIQGLSNNLINYSLIESIEALKTKDPWLYAEILTDYNWDKGIAYINNLLTTNYDGPYLFSLLPDWKANKSKFEIEKALNLWYPNLQYKDQELAELYAKNYGFEFNNLSEKNKVEVDKILSEMPQFQNWISETTPNLFKTLRSYA